MNVFQVIGVLKNDINKSYTNGKYIFSVDKNNNLEISNSKGELLETFYNKWLEVDKDMLMLEQKQLKLFMNNEFQHNIIYYSPQFLSRMICDEERLTDKEKNQEYIDFLWLVSKNDNLAINYIMKVKESRPHATYSIIDKDNKCLCKFIGYLNYFKEKDDFIYFDYNFNNTLKKEESSCSSIQYNSKIESGYHAAMGSYVPKI